MIQNLQDEIYQLEEKQAKGVNLLLILDRRLSTKNVAKISSKYLVHWIRAKLVYVM